MRTINELIVPLSGKYAAHDLIVYENVSNQFNSMVFSNDGIHVLRSTEFMSPIQQYLASAIEYIAQRVDDAAGDGTSTAIYFATRLLEIYLTESRSLSNVHLNNYVDDVVSLLEDMEESIVSSSIDIDSLEDADRSKMIFNMAMTVSKGNKVLSDYVVTIFSSIPDTLYEFSYFDRNSKETDNEFEVIYPEYDKVLNIVSSANTKYNAELYTVVVHDDCDILVCPNDKDIIEFVDDRLSKDNRHLVVLYNELPTAIENALETFSPDRITVCRNLPRHPSIVSNPVELFSVLAMAGKETPVTIEDGLIEGVSVYINNNSLCISGILPEDTVDMHPLYSAKTCTLFDRLEKELRNCIRDTNINKRNDSFLTKEYTRIYKDMVCPKLPTLSIGGSATEHLSNINVVEDVLGAISVAMKHGVCVDFFHDHSGISTDSRIVQVANEFRDICGDSEFDDTVIQSTKSLTETFKRICEMIPGLIKVQHVIVPNSVVIAE